MTSNYTMEDLLKGKQEGDSWRVPETDIVVTHMGTYPYTTYEDLRNEESK